MDSEKVEMAMWKLFGHVEAQGCLTEAEQWYDYFIYSLMMV